MADLQEYVLKLAIEKMAQQKADLRELRSRASYILTSAGVINGAFIATYSGGTSKKVFEFLAIVFFTVAAALISWTFVSRKSWVFSSVVDQMYSTFKDYDLAVWVPSVAEATEERWNANNKRMDVMTLLMNLGLSLLAMSLVAWIFTI